MPITDTVTTTHEIHSYYISLPSGDVGAVQMSATVGDVAIALLLTILVFMLLFVIVRYYAHEARV